jgi:hypothetical protein
MEKVGRLDTFGGKETSRSNFAFRDRYLAAFKRMIFGAHGWDGNGRMDSVGMTASELN